LECILEHRKVIHSSLTLINFFIEFYGHKEYLQSWERKKIRVFGGTRK